jgi:hypothetical protein
VTFELMLLRAYVRAHRYGKRWELAKAWSDLRYYYGNRLPEVLGCAG